MSSTATSIQTVAVALGAVIGAVLRWRVSVWLNPATANLPLGTLAVNCLGGLMAGACLVWFARMPNETLRLLLVTGFLGGLTTFSTFSAESLAMVERGRMDLAAMHSLVHVLGSLACAGLGARMTRALLA